MNKFTMSILAVSGLSLSMTACAPAFKGEGTQKPNLAKQAAKTRKLHAGEAESLAHIDKIVRDGRKFQLVLKNTDLAENQATIEITIDSSYSQEVGPVKESRLSDEFKYTVEAACSDDACSLLGAVVTKEKRQTELLLEQETTDQTQAAPAQAEAKTEEAAAPQDLETEQLDTQAQTTAPVSRPTVVTEGTTKTGKVVSFAAEDKDGKTKIHLVLDSQGSFHDLLTQMNQEVSRLIQLGL